MKSIRFKITAITIAAILTCTLAVFATCFFTVRREYDRRTVENMNLQTQNAAKTLNRYFQSIQQSTEIAAIIASDSIDSVILVECGAAGKSSLESPRTPEQEALLDNYLREYCADVQHVFSSIASQTQGVITYYYCLNPEISENEHGFFYSRAGKTGFFEQPPLDARQLDPLDLEHTTWYFTPIRRGRPSWVGPYTAHFLNEIWIFSYLVPIYKSGSLIGVLGMDLKLDTLIDQINQIRIGKTGYASLLSDNGEIIYHPNYEIGSDPGIILPEKYASVLSNESSKDLQIRYEIDGEQRQMSFCTLSNGMKLVLAASVHELNEPWTRFVRIIVLVTAALLTVFTLLVLFLMGFLTRPLEHLTAASRHLADADYNTLLDYKGNDEVGELTSAFQEMRSQLKLYIDDLNHRIHTDALTDLPNMRYFFELSEAEKKWLTENSRQPAILFFNLIGMKHYNRQYGFAAGDDLIREFGQLLASHFGLSCVGHFGQDHFAVITEEAGMEETLKTIFAECAGLNHGNSLPVRVGIYPLRLEDVGTDIACDRAKYACDQHRSSYESHFYYFNQTMLKEAEDVRYIISHLDQALEERWIEVLYQPIIRSSTGRVSDEEALSRWSDPDRGFFSPAKFIPVLENARLIYKLDLYVLDRVIEKIRNEQKAGLSIVPHSVNLSRSDFDACDIVEEIRSRVDAAGIPHDRFTIEITESMIGSDFEFMKSQIDRFRSLGFPVWMDDFGSGYSSLDVLQSIEFDLIKFDMSFMRKLDEGNSGRIILSELMVMAQSLGLDTLCEGVETESQVQFLKEIGCSKMQGWYFSKAISFEAIMEQYRNGTWMGYESNEEALRFDALIQETAAAKQKQKQLKKENTDES
ncbi:MAG: EAL domain-containing protein [Solobacterium sp.]|nr:EAL domain-containing protein [Solobacterium sp.]